MKDEYVNQVPLFFSDTFCGNIASSTHTVLQDCNSSTHLRILFSAVSPTSWFAHVRKKMFLPPATQKQSR